MFWSPIKAPAPEKIPMRRASIGVDASSTTTPRRISGVWGFLWGSVGVSAWEQHPQIEDDVLTPPIRQCPGGVYLGNAGGDALSCVLSLDYEAKQQ
jgi:hypothetical protein